MRVFLRHREREARSRGASQDSSNSSREQPGSATLSLISLNRWEMSRYLSEEPQRYFGFGKREIKRIKQEEKREREAVTT